MVAHLAVRCELRQTMTNGAALGQACKWPRSGEQMTDTNTNIVTVKLHPITKHGKQRLERFGNVWIVQERTRKRWLLRSLCGHDLRWIDWPDRDFEVVEVTSSPQT